MRSLFKLCMLLVLVVLIVYASRVNWQTETFENNSYKTLGVDLDAHGCNMAAGFHWCESANKCRGPSEEECPETSNIVTGGSQGCNEHNNNDACVQDKKCVLYRKNGGTGNSFCYPKCSTITDPDECNNNSRSFCEYKDGKCKYKCSNFNANSTLDNHLNACQMSDGCKAHNDECVETDTTTSNSHQHHSENIYQTESSSDKQSIGMENKSNFPDLTIEDDQNSNVYKIFNKDKEVGNLPKCLMNSTENTQGQMVENGEGTFLCKGMNVCLDNSMLNFVGGISSELNAKELVEKINQSCENLPNLSSSFV